MPSFFSAAYRFAGEVKIAPLPEWLAHSLDDRFEGDLGLAQTTRLPVHQTKARLAAAAIDAVEEEEGRELPLDDIDAALIERGLGLCVARHVEAWRSLCPGTNIPSFAHAFELHAREAGGPAFMQCPEPPGLRPVAETQSLKLLPDFGFAVPSLTPVVDEMQQACQLMAFAAKQFYVKGQPTGSRPLAQAVAIDLPGKPGWRFRHEVACCLSLKEFCRGKLGLEGQVVFAWLLPFLPLGKPIPRQLQHPFLLDVGSPMRLRPNGRVAVYSKTCRMGGSDMQLGNAALGPRDAWPAAGLPGIAITTGAMRRSKGHQTGKAAALGSAGLEVKPLFVQRPFGKIPGSADIVGLIASARLSGGNDSIGVPVLDIYDRADGFDLPAGAELVIEGEPIGASTTATWLDVRIPLPDPSAGAERLRTRWCKWQATVERQIDQRAKRADQFRAIAYSAFLRRHAAGEREPGEKARKKAGGS